MHLELASHQPQPSVLVQCVALPMAAHLGSQGMLSSFVAVSTTFGAFITGGRCDTQSALSSNE
jgi:hypothetical protein